MKKMLRKAACPTILAVFAATAACLSSAEDYPRLLAEGERLLQEGAWEEALELFDDLHRRFPEERQPLVRLVQVADRLGRPEAAIPVLEERIAAGGPDVHLDHQMLGAQLAKAQRTEDAKRHYREVLRLQPESGADYLELSRLEARSGDYDRALEVAAEGVRRVPGDPRLRSWYGEALMKRGRWKEAEAVLLRAREIAGAGAYPRFVLGLVYLNRGRLADARRELEVATELEADAHEAWYQLANVCERLGDLGARDRALEEFARLYRRRLGIGG